MERRAKVTSMFGPFVETGTDGVWALGVWFAAALALHR